MVTERITSFERYGILKGKRDAILKQLHHKFGELPTSVEAKLKTIHDEPGLDRLLEMVLDAHSLAEMGFTEA